MLAELQKASLEARKTKSPKSKMLGLILADAQARAKKNLEDVNDGHVKDAASSWVKKMSDVCKSFPTEDNLLDLEVAKQFAPKLLSEEESVELAKAYVEANGFEKKQMGKVIAHLSAAHEGLSKQAVSKFLGGLK